VLDLPIGILTLAYTGIIVHFLFERQRETWYTVLKPVPAYEHRDLALCFCFSANPRGLKLPQIGRVPLTIF
jgi:hypothetical protein